VTTLKYAMLFASVFVRSKNTSSTPPNRGWTRRRRHLNELAVERWRRRLRAEAQDVRRTNR